MVTYNTQNPQISIWEDRIERSKKFRKRMLKDVKSYIQFYEGKQWGNKRTVLTEKPVINLVYAHIKVQLPFLYFQNPKWFCNVAMPLRGEEELKRNAALAEHFLNYYATENLGISLKKQMRLAILDAFFSFGVIKVGYVGEFETNPSYGKFQTLGTDEAGDPIYETNGYGEIMKDDEEEILTHEAFYARRISPTHLLFDPEGENYFEDGRYIIQEIVKSVEDVKASKLYENVEDLQPSFNVRPGYGDYEAQLEDLPELQDDLDRITLYEIYDLEHDKLKVYAEGHDEFLRDEDMPDGIDHCPFEFLRYNEVPDRVYPMSDIESAKTLQEEINVGRGMIMTHAKRFARKYGYTDETFSGTDGATEMENIKDPEDGTFFKVNSFEAMPKPLENAPLDASVYQNFQQAFVDFREVMGSTEADRGLVERRKTATEAGYMAKASGIRKEDRKSLVEDFAAGVGKKLLQSMQANLTNEHAVQIAGMKGQEWQSITRENIIGDFSVGVEIGSVAPQLPEFERQELMQVLQVVTQFPQEVVMAEVNFSGLMRNLHKYFPLLDMSEVLNTPEVAQQIRQSMEAEKKAMMQQKQQGQQKPQGGK